jgi:hypothetical protein
MYFIIWHVNAVRLCIRDGIDRAKTNVPDIHISPGGRDGSDRCPGVPFWSQRIKRTKKSQRNHRVAKTEWRDREAGRNPGVSWEAILRIALGSRAIDEISLLFRVRARLAISVKLGARCSTSWRVESQVARREKVAVISAAGQPQPASPAIRTACRRCDSAPLFALFALLRNL